MKSILIVVNSPGEILGFAKPVIFSLREEMPNIRIIVIVPFCQFQGGQEVQFLQDMNGVERVFSWKGYLKVLFFGGHPSLPTPWMEDGVILHLGGDPLYSLLLSRRLKIPVAVYTECPRGRWIKSFDRVLVPSISILDGMDGVMREKVEVIGDLMVDASRLEVTGNLGVSTREGEYSVAFFPGSKKSLVQHLIPFFLKVAEGISERSGQVRFFMSQAEILGSEDFLDSLTFSGGQKAVLDGSRGRLVNGVIETERCVQLTPFTKLPKDLIENLDLAITIPGTITGILSALGVPILVVCPLNRPELLPFEGVMGLVGYLPIFGPLLKRKVVRLFLKRHPIPLLSIPNIRGRKKVIPEVTGVVSCEDVVDAATVLLRDQDRRRDIVGFGREVMGVGGGAGQLVEVLKGMIDQGA